MFTKGRSIFTKRPVPAVLLGVDIVSQASGIFPASERKKRRKTGKCEGKYISVSLRFFRSLAEKIRLACGIGVDTDRRSVNVALMDKISSLAYCLGDRYLEGLPKLVLTNGAPCLVNPRPYFVNAHARVREIRSGSRPHTGMCVNRTVWKSEGAVSSSRFHSTFHPHQPRLLRIRDVILTHC